MITRFRPSSALAFALSVAAASEAHADPPVPGRRAAAASPPETVGAPPGSPPRPSAADRKRAAAAFDEGVARYARAEFAEAARAFLEADRLGPSAVAISNAIAAAKRAGDHLLVARTAERAIARGDAVIEAREALADAATRLARLELTCEATPCALSLDGEAAGGTVYVLPGTHRLEASGAAGATAEQRVVVAAGATYQLALRPEAHEGAPRPPPDTRDGGSPPPPDPGASSGRRGLPPAIFVTGAAVTAVLTCVFAWSGADALAAKHALPAAPDQAQENDVLARARRTDYLLLGAGLAGVGSAILAGLTFRGSAVVAPVPGGAWLGVGGRF